METREKKVMRSQFVLTEVLLFYRILPTAGVINSRPADEFCAARVNVCNTRRLGIDSQQGRIFLLAFASRPALGPTQSPTQ
jgi:hypothetical protein